MNYLEKRVTVVCGHYGVGKTNLSINLALDCAEAGHRVTLIDMDGIAQRRLDHIDVLVLTNAGAKKNEKLAEKATKDVEFLKYR